MQRHLCILIIGFALFCCQAYAETIHVPGDRPTIQAGIDAAVHGDTVLVADGCYSGDGNRDIDFQGKAIEVVSENGSEFTVIDCGAIISDYHRGFYFCNGETNQSKLDGFRVIN